MSFIHYLWLGYFERDGEHLRFARGPDGAYRPVIRRPINPVTIKATLPAGFAAETEPLRFPDEWSVWAEGGYLVCDKYTRNEGEVEFVTRLVERTGCDIYDAAGHSTITLAEWLAVTPGTAKT